MLHCNYLQFNIKMQTTTVANWKYYAVLKAYLASYPGLFTPAFVAYRTNVGERLVKLSHVQWPTWTCGGVAHSWKNWSECALPIANTDPRTTEHSTSDRLGNVSWVQKAALQQKFVLMELLEMKITYIHYYEIKIGDNRWPNVKCGLADSQTHKLVLEMKIALILADIERTINIKW